MTPFPCAMAAALAQVISRAKISLLGPLVPPSNSVRLAEELAMVDMLGGGRLVVLFLRGTANRRQNYDTDATATLGMTQEGIDLIVKAIALRGTAQNITSAPFRSGQRRCKARTRQFSVRATVPNPSASPSHAVWASPSPSSRQRSCRIE